ncbi:Beta-barrel assembly machine subunit BamC [Pasteurella langaaensis DSM 22999]|uniref:Outer membrane protein assembly factor BamC n=1 Tax=Alitibacter langaaensis DSM 22999 TaxID=1122935 RepID=A0A2U0TCP4_9PAST|nr:outer membrane protein assembly factor BamC [Pasteurella langaaensis]PVX41359.1 Beta-barrel assembly machine subunit BamC [Pasteurella langaaensis DSM 22999]
MKKLVLAVTALATLAACSSPESRRLANDSYSKHAADTIKFATLDTAGLTIIGAENTYQLPTENVKKGEAMDIRPPSKPMAIIQNSVAQFDGNRASIVYPAERQSIYNIQQVQRLLTEKGIAFKANGNQVQTEWTHSDRHDDAGNVQVRYIIEELGNQQANALVVAVSDMKRDDIVTTPTTKEKELYASDLLNQLVGELNTAYRTQQQQTALPTNTGPIQAAIINDVNNQTALAMTSNFNQSWTKLGNVLPELGFEITEETVGRGYRSLKYKALDATSWARFGTTQPELEDGEYSMQLSAYGNQSAVVISNKDKEALSGESATAVYQALMNLITK